jgi:uncharacterized protein (DUF2147 family)
MVTEIKVIGDDDERRRLAIQEEEKLLKREEVEQKRIERTREDLSHRAKVMADRAAEVRKAEEEEGKEGKEKGSGKDVINLGRSVDLSNVDKPSSSSAGHTRVVSIGNLFYGSSSSSSSSSSWSSSKTGQVITSEEVHGYFLASFDSSYARSLLETIAWPSIMSFISAMEVFPVPVPFVVFRCCFCVFCGTLFFSFFFFFYYSFLSFV